MPSCHTKSVTSPTPAHTTNQHKVEERGLVHAHKLAVPAADFVLRLGDLRQLEVILHVLNDLGQNAGVHILQRDDVLPVLHVCECRRFEGQNDEHKRNKVAQDKGEMRPPVQTRHVRLTHKVEQGGSRKPPDTASPFHC